MPLSPLEEMLRMRKAIRIRGHIKTTVSWKMRYFKRATQCYVCPCEIRGSLFLSLSGRPFVWRNGRPSYIFCPGRYGHSTWCVNGGEGNVLLIYEGDTTVPCYPVSYCPWLAINGPALLFLWDSVVFLCRRWRRLLHKNAQMLCVRPSFLNVSSVKVGSPCVTEWQW